MILFVNFTHHNDGYLLQLYGPPIAQATNVTFSNTSYINGKFNKGYVTKRRKAPGIKYPVIYDSSSIQLNKQLPVFGYPAKFILTKSGNLIFKTDQSDMSLTSFELFLKEHQQCDQKRGSDIPIYFSISPCHCLFCFQCPWRSFSERRRPAKYRVL